MRNIGKYADNVMNVMRENAHFKNDKIVGENQEKF
jgi:hypothetical protein